MDTEITKIEKVPASGMIEIEHPANADGFIVSVPIVEPDPSLAGMPDYGPRGATAEHGRLATEPEPWVPTPLNLTADRMTQELSDREGRVNTAQRAYDLSAMLYATELGEWERTRDHALTGVVGERRAQIEKEYETKKTDRLGSYLQSLAATETAATRAADDLDRFAQRVGVSVRATPPVLPESLRSKAAELLPILRAEVETLPLGTLRDRLRLALQTEDDTSTYLLATLLPARLDTRTAPASGTLPDGRIRLDMADDPARSDLRGLVATARARFKDGSLSGLATEATKGRDKAGALRTAVTRGRRTRMNQPAPFLASYQRMYPSPSPDVPWTAPEKPKPRLPTRGLNPVTGEPFDIPQ